MKQGRLQASLIHLFIAGMILNTAEVHGQPWEHVRNLPLGDHPADTRISMDAEGDLLVIGFASASGGVVRIHRRNEEGLGQWGVVQELNSDEPYFGHAVAIRNEKIAIGAPGAHGEGAWTGAVFLCSLQPGELIESVQVEDTLRGVAAGDRFGYSLVWSGEPLVIGAVGRSLDRFTGAVVVHDDQAFPNVPMPLPTRWQDSQVPFTRWFGGSMALGDDRLVVAAPFTGFRSDVDQQNIGALFAYTRDENEPSGWGLDTVWYDTSLLTDGCTFGHIEMGRNGLAFAGEALVIDHGLSYDGGPGNGFLPFQSLGENVAMDGCTSCRLRVATQQVGQWSFDAMAEPQHAAEWDRMAERAWTTDEEALYVERVNSGTGVWGTMIHLRDAGAPGAWGVEAIIPALDDACDVLSGPLEVSGDDLMRVALRRMACDVPTGVLRAELQIFAR